MRLNTSKEGLWVWRVGGIAWQYRALFGRLQALERSARTGSNADPIAASRNELQEDRSLGLPSRSLLDAFAASAQAHHV